MIKSTSIKLYLIFITTLLFCNIAYAQHTIYPDLFIIGSDSIQEGGTNELFDNRFIFDIAKAGFSGGRMDMGPWHRDSIGRYSFSSGFSSKASGDFGTTAFGIYTVASGDYGATALGAATIASGAQGATALGVNSKASGYFGATALGSVTQASGDFGATALGFFVKARGDFGATAMGQYTIANANSGIVTGQYNDTIVTVGYDEIDKPLFIIGNGTTDTTRSNAMVVRGNGKIGLGLNNPEAYLHIKADDNLDEPHLKITDPGTDAFVRIELNREGIDKSWFHSATTKANDADSYYSFIYEDDSATLIPVIRMNGLGNTGFGRFPSANRLEVNGSASKTVAGDWLANSDRRIKTDITDITDSYELIKQLRPVKFHYSEEWKRLNPSIEDHYYYNFIAQEYREVFPESVQGSGQYIENDNEEILQIDTYNAQILTIAAVKELIKENELLRNKLNDLEAMIHQIKSQKVDMGNME